MSIMYLISFLLLFFLIQTSSADKFTLPVFIIDYEGDMSDINLQPNPFNTVGSMGFASIVFNAIKNCQGIVIFVEEKFCNENISTKDAIGSPYHHLHRALLDQKAKFLPAVVDPYTTLKQIFRPEYYNTFYLSSAMNLELVDTNFKYIYVFFDDHFDETKAQVLTRHDLIMKKVYYKVRQLKSGPVLAFYTGKKNPIIRDKVKFVPVKPLPVPKDMSVLIVSAKALFRFSGVFSTTAKRRSMFNQHPMVAEETWTRRKLSTRMAYTDFEMQFNFAFGDKDWTLDNVALLEGGEEVGRTVMHVNVPWNNSYVCGEPLVLVNSRDGSFITISQYQIQPHTQDLKDYAGQGQNESGRFRAGVNCSPYFTSSILACFFVTFLCFGITMYGVISLFNCCSNNRYEDPQGKPLVITES